MKEYLNSIQNSFSSILNKYKDTLKNLDHYQKLSESFSNELDEMKNEIKMKNNSRNGINALSNLNHISDNILNEMINNSVQDVVINTLNEKISLLNKSNQFRDDINKYSDENLKIIKAKQNELNQKLIIINGYLDELSRYKNNIINSNESYINNPFVKDILIKIKEVLNILLKEMPSSIYSGFEIQKYYEFFDSLENNKYNNNNNGKGQYGIIEFIEKMRNISKEIKYFVENRISIIESNNKYQEVLKRNNELEKKYELLKNKLNEKENQNENNSFVNINKGIDIHGKVNNLKNDFNNFLDLLSNINSEENIQESNQKYNDIVNKSKNLSLNMNELLSSINTITTKKDVDIDKEINNEMVYKNKIQLLTDEISSLVEQRDYLYDQILTLKDEQMDNIDKLNKSNAEINFLKNNSNSAWSRLEKQLKKYEKLKNNYESYISNSDNRINELINKNNELLQKGKFYEENINSLKKENRNLSDQLKNKNTIVMLEKSNSTLNNGSSNEEISNNEDNKNKYNILKKKYDFIKEQYNKIKTINDDNESKVDEYSKKYNYIYSQYNKVRPIKLERDDLLNSFNLLKEFSTEYKIPIDEQNKNNNEMFVRSIIEYIKSKFSSNSMKEKIYEELNDEINEIIDSNEYLLQNAINNGDEDFESHLKEVIEKLIETKDKTNKELSNIINTEISEPRKSLELKLEKLRNNLKLQSNENRFLQQKLKNTEKTTEEMTSKIANEFSNILKQYDKLNEEISNVHSVTSEDILSFNNSNIINDSPNSMLNNSNNKPNSIINDNIYLNNMQSESLLMDMTFWSTSDDDYSIEQNLNPQKKLSKRPNSMNNDNVLLNNNDEDILLNNNYNYSKSNNSYPITTHQISNIKSNESSKSANTIGSNNIELLKHMFSKIIKQKNIT